MGRSGATVTQMWLIEPAPRMSARVTVSPGATVRSKPSSTGVVVVYPKRTPSKRTSPRTGGKSSASKDLALQAISYGSVYVARVALGADPENWARTLVALEIDDFDEEVVVATLGVVLKHVSDQEKAVHELKTRRRN